MKFLGDVSLGMRVSSPASSVSKAKILFKVQIATSEDSLMSSKLSTSSLTCDDEAGERDSKFSRRYFVPREIVFKGVRIS